MRPRRVGGWLPAEQGQLEKWIGRLLAEVEAKPAPLHPVLRELQSVIETDPSIYMLFHQMYEQLPHRPRFFKDPTGAPQVHDYRTMLKLLNAVITRAPEYDDSCMVGLPINAILDWPLGTGAGASAFLNAKVNDAFRHVLKEWARFLSSKDSRYVLTDEPGQGWFSPDARRAMPDFEAEFECDPSAPYHGYQSWDEFFTRKFRPGRRPIADEGDDRVIINPCESAPYRLAEDIRERDQFWIKAQPYSLAHMLANHANTKQFVGGTIYQSFLSAVSYHRWHSPVSGRIVETQLVPGSYYAQAHSEGLDRDGVHDSQAYLTEVATRALIFIEADHPGIGLMCFIPVGMGEVSSCELAVYEGQHVRKGDPIGAFHYGGSTQCLLFRPGVKLEFDLHGQKPGLKTENILVNARLATIL